MMKSGDFKPPKSGVVNTNVQKEVEEDDEPLKDVNDVEKFVDFIRHDHFNVGGIDDKPNKDDHFDLFGVAFGELLMPQAQPKGPSKPPKTGIALADVKPGRGGKKSGRGGRLTLEWWKCYLDSCALYHTFFSRHSSRTSKKAVAR